MYRKVSTSDAEKLAQKENIMYFETSAKTGQNVNKMFFTAVAHLSFFDVYNLPINKIAEELGIIN
jgi:hypothetical protein